MTTKAKLSAFTLALVLGIAVSGCSSDDPGSPETDPPQASTPSGTGSPTASTTEPATPEPAATPSSTSPSTSSAPASPKPTVGSVGVLITTSEWDPTTGVTVRGYANTVDAEAACTLELTKSGITRTVTSEALESPTTMSCGELTIGPADLSPGDWTAVLSYESTTAWGTSTPVVVAIP